MTNPKMMNSGKPRIKDDDYKTIDPRCVLGLMEHFNLKDKLVIDPCSPTGSGIIEQIASHKIQCFGMPDYRLEYCCDWVISNPPYKRPLVDDIVWDMIERLYRGGTIKDGVALLLRTNFDHAKSREKFFELCPNYYGQIKLLFRPTWFAKQDGDATPFHNFVWHIWTNQDNPFLNVDFTPRVLYSEGK